nr:MAG TPA: hypothetical protein [Caudoviricetes sp.]
MYHNLAVSFIFLSPLDKFQKLKLCFIRKRQRGAYQFFAQHFNICSAYCITFRVITQHLASLRLALRLFFAPHPRGCAQSARAFRLSASALGADKAPPPLAPVRPCFDLLFGIYIYSHNRRLLHGAVQQNNNICKRLGKRKWVF